MNREALSVTLERGDPVACDNCGAEIPKSRAAYCVTVEDQKLVEAMGGDSFVLCSPRCFAQMSSWGTATPRYADS